MGEVIAESPVVIVEVEPPVADRDFRIDRKLLIVDQGDSRRSIIISTKKK